MIQSTWKAMQSGTYDYTALIGVVAAVAGAIVEIASHADTVPPSIAPYLRLAEPWARFVMLVGTVLAAQGKRMIVPTPLRGDPSLHDDESGQ